jgi:hypothetical protein
MSHINDLEFIDRQVKFMYGKYYDDVIRNNYIHVIKSEYDLYLNDCLQCDDINYIYNNSNTPGRLESFIHILRKYWKKDSNGYRIASDWNDNREYDMFIITYNRKHNTLDQILFPLSYYTSPQMMRISDNIDFRHKENKLFWRGSSTGHDDININKRYQIISKNFHANPEFDLGFSGFCQNVYTNNTEEFNKLRKDFLDKEQQTKFKFILNIEGNDVASSFPWALASNCCPLHNYPFEYETIIFGCNLEPFVHFVPINNDGSDLIEKYNWCMNNLDTCEKIAENGKIYMEKYLREDLFDDIITRFFNLYPKNIMMEIKYVCSLGSLCHSSQILINNNLKKCSYPFDWIFSNYNNIIHCLETDFNIFLDKSYYVSISERQCSHSLYYNCMFNHHNPLDNTDHYNYYIRCVNRFKQLLQFEEQKLFIMIFTNMDNIEENLKNDIINFNNKFSKYTKNYTLLVIFHIKNKENNHHMFTHNDNIYFLELHTLSSSNGVSFTNNEDDDYLNNIIKSTYNFNIEN